MTTSSDEYRFRVRSYEIDAYRHVNNAAYLNWLEDARERFLRREERDYGYYPEHDAAYFVVVRIEIDYLAAAHGDDEIAVTTRLARLGSSSVVFRQVIRNALTDAILARARVVMCFGDGASSSVPMPPDFRLRFVSDPAGDMWKAEEGGER